MLKKQILFAIMVTSFVACGHQPTLMKGSWQEIHDTHTPPAKLLVGKWQSKDMPFTLMLDPRSDSDGSIAFIYNDYSIVDNNCQLEAYPVRPSYESEVISIRFFADNLKGLQEPALEITGTVAGDSLQAKIAFKYDPKIVTTVWNTTLYRVHS